MTYYVFSRRRDPIGDEFIWRTGPYPNRDRALQRLFAAFNSGANVELVELDPKTGIYKSHMKISHGGENV